MVGKGIILMMDYIIRRFVADPDAIRDSKTRNQYGHVASVTGIIVNTLVFIGELLVGFFTGSIALISDGIHNMADAGGACISLLSFRLADMKPDKEHPYGHGRIEYLFSVGFSVLLFVVAIQLAIESYDRIMHPDIVTMTADVIIMMVVIMGMKVWLFTVLRTIGNRIDSPILKANGLEYLSDVWATAGITVGLVVGTIFGFSIDGYLGAFVSCMIARAGFLVFKEATSRLLGNEPSAGRIKEIAEFVTGYEGVIGVHDLMIHDYGPGHEFASIHVEVDAKTDVMTSHALVDQIEHDAVEKLHLQLTIHMDPIVQDERTKAVNERIINMITAYNKAYRIHDLRTVWNGLRMVVSFDVAVPYGKKNDLEAIQSSLTGIIEALYPNCEAHIYVENSYTGLLLPEQHSV